MRAVLSLMEKLSEGQLVELKSGGPKMTVKSLGGSNAVCTWFSDQKLSERTFPFTSLIPVHAEFLSDEVLDEIARESRKSD